jgi:tetratricopeptide (TPR) repeat protein
LAAVALLLASSPASATAVEPPLNPEGAGFVSLLRQAGLYREAAGEVLRQNELSGAPELDADLLFGLGLDLARTGSVPAAISVVELAVARTQDAALNDDRQLILGTLHLKEGSYPAAERVFTKVETFSADALARARAERLACVGSLWSLDADPARQCVPKLISIAGSVSARAQREAERQLDELGASDAWRGWLGGILSGILPGLGQATAGEPLDGLVALLVNGGWGVGVVAVSLGGDVVDGALLLVAVLTRYYWGNIQHGAADWTAATERSKRRAADALMRLIAGLPEPSLTLPPSPR